MEIAVLLSFIPTRVATIITPAFTAISVIITGAIVAGLLLTVRLALLSPAVLALLSRSGADSQRTRKHGNRDRSVECVRSHGVSFCSHSTRWMAERSPKVGIGEPTSQAAKVLA